MAKITVKNIVGKDVKEIEISDVVFSVSANDTLLHQVYVAQTGNGRIAIAHTKDRSERTGSGIKPWRQKGTGRARVGTVRSPLWRKGGVTFGPTKDRNFSKNTNQKMRQKATMIALSEKVRSGKMIVFDALQYPEKKTKLFFETLRVCGMNGKSVIVGVTSDERAMVIISRNIPKTEQTPIEMLNVMQLLDHEYLIVTEAGVKHLEKRFAVWNKN
ncbi:MAG TPA: 50S ribosomal protein L4, partial [Patescibacteria group bacterium]|nr:50S ribosomal protein L4 [Patescibacteria group bacterium]